MRCEVPGAGRFADVGKYALMGWFRISLIKSVRGMIVRSFKATLRPSNRE
jgi:hypothetical protein